MKEILGGNPVGRPSKKKMSAEQRKQVEQELNQLLEDQERIGLKVIDGGKAKADNG